MNQDNAQWVARRFGMLGATRLNLYPPLYAGAHWGVSAVFPQQRLVIVEDMPSAEAVIQELKEQLV